MVRTNGGGGAGGRKGGGGSDSKQIDEMDIRRQRQIKGGVGEGVRKNKWIISRV